MSGHTPGPWAARWSDFSDKFEVYEIKGNDDFGPGVENTAVAEIQDHEYEGEDEGRNEANARLIAAAPELLDAIKMLRSQYVLFVGPDDGIATAVLAEVDAAIAKAECSA